MTTATFINLAESTITASSPVKAHTQNDKAACYLYFTPLPGTSSVGIHHDNNKSNMRTCTVYQHAKLSAQNQKVTTPPTVPLEVALAIAHLDGSFDMEEIDIVVHVSELGTHDELHACILNIFDREGHA